MHDYLSGVDIALLMKRETIGKHTYTTILLSAPWSLFPPLF